MTPQPTDTIIIEDLVIECIIGLYEWEREVPQVVNVSLEIPCDIKQVATTDSIENALDYHTLSQSIISLVSASKFQLLETLVETIAQHCLKTFNLEWIRLRVDKPAALRGARTVGIVIYRERKIVE